MSDEIAKVKCAHAGCICEVDEGQTFCGPFCAATAGEAVSTDQPCECGHEVCKRLTRPMPA